MEERLRPRFLGNMLRAGVREGVAMAVTGHKTRSMFDRYAITSGDDVRAAMERSAGKAPGRPAPLRREPTAPRAPGAVAIFRTSEREHGENAESEIVSATPGVLEVADLFGGPSRTRTLDPLIKSCPEPRTQDTQADLSPTDQSDPA